jgi:hypothetical protein
MKTHHARLAWVAAAAIAGALTFALVAPLQAASPAEGQPAPGTMDHGAAGTMDHGPVGAMDHGAAGTMDHGPVGAMDHGAAGTMDHGAAGMMDHAKPSDGDMRGMMQHHEQMMEMMTRMHGSQMQAGVPALPGQDAFGAVAEVVRMLEADPKTDWSKIDLEALRQHLIDMNDVTLRADVVAKPIDGGLEMAVTGSGRTLAAIQRMVPAHATEINGRNGWTATTALLDKGVLLRVTASDTKEVSHIRGLGFIGILVSGSHHQPHHLAMAKGEPVHSGQRVSAEHAQHVH